MSTALDRSTYYELGRRFQDDPVPVVEDYLGVQLAETQAEIARAISEHPRVLIVSGNGTGKSYGVSIYALAFFLFNYNSLTMITSGNYDLLTDASWRPMKSIHKHVQSRDPDCPGRRLESPPRIESGVTDEWFLRYISPRYPDNLEGRHARRALVVIEEADKPDITAEHFDSATSTASSQEDRLVAVANPPTDKGNIVYEKMEDDRWHVINFSSFDSHNVQVELGERDDDTIPGVVSLDLIREDWEAWNSQPWPGVEHARQFQSDLDPRWYRRRLGVMPPSGAGVLRPWYERDVDTAVGRWDPDDTYPVERDSLGFDIARGGGDRTAGVERRRDLLEVVLERGSPGDHTVNEDLILDVYDRAPVEGETWIDAVGEGSGVADNIRMKRPNVKRFQAGNEARDDSEYRNRGTEALIRLGNFIQEKAVIKPGSSLEKELRMGARVYELEERTLRENTVLFAKGKDEMKKTAYLGRSPDILDAASLATYAQIETNTLLPGFHARTA